MKFILWYCAFWLMSLSAGATRMSSLRPETINDDDDVQFWQRFLETFDGSFSADQGMVTDSPTTSPNDSPSKVPTTVPSDTPTVAPSDIPTPVPSHVPTTVPSFIPTATPSDVPTTIPSEIPTEAPSDEPTTVPSDIPTATPSDAPSTEPSDVPTATPSKIPTNLPSDVPTNIPSSLPSGSPTKVPSNLPTGAPSLLPSTTPTRKPTKRPTDTDSAVNDPDKECKIQAQVHCYQADNGLPCDAIPLQREYCSGDLESVMFLYDPEPCAPSNRACEDFGHLFSTLPASIKCTNGDSIELTVVPSILFPGSIVTVQNVNETALPTTIQCLIAHTALNVAQIITIHRSNNLRLAKEFGSLQLVSCGSQSCQQEILEDIIIYNVGDSNVNVTNVTVSSNQGSKTLPIPDQALMLDQFMTFTMSSNISVCNLETYIAQVAVDATEVQTGNVCGAFANTSADTECHTPSDIPSDQPSSIPSNSPSSSISRFFMKSMKAPSFPSMSKKRGYPCMSSNSVKSPSSPSASMKYRTPTSTNMATSKQSSFPSSIPSLLEEFNNAPSGKGGKGYDMPPRQSPKVV